MATDWTIHVYEDALKIAWKGLKSHASVDLYDGEVLNPAAQAMEKIEAMTGRKWDDHVD